MFGCSFCQAQISIMKDYWVLGVHCLPLGGMLELFNAVCATCLGDANVAEHEEVTLSDVSVPTLSELPQDANTATPLLVVTLHAGRLLATGSSASQHSHLCDGRLGRSADADLMPTQTPVAQRACSRVTTGIANRGVVHMCHDMQWATLQAPLGLCCRAATGARSAQADIVGDMTSGFIMNPAVLQAAASDCTPSAHGASVPTAAACVCLPTAARHSAAVVRSSSSAAAICSASRTVTTLQGLRHSAAKQILQPHQADRVHLPSLVYDVSWQAMELHTGTDLGASLQPSLLFGVPLRSRRGAPPHMSQDASVAAAHSLQLLHSHRVASLTSISLALHGGVPAQPVLGMLSRSTSGAAIGGVLKNLPFEMPSLTAHLLVCDPAGWPTGQPGSLSVQRSTSVRALADLPDMYGSASRSGTLHRPLLVYIPASRPTERAASLAAAGVQRCSYVITGGLGGLGMLTALWLGTSGPRSLVLSSRSGTSAVRGTRIMQSMSVVSCAKCDVSFAEDAQLQAHTVRCLKQQFGGIAHTAGLQVAVVPHAASVQICDCTMKVVDP